jgi:hypothetical protein
MMAKSVAAATTDKSQSGTGPLIGIESGRRVAIRPSIRKIAPRLSVRRR